MITEQNRINAMITAAGGALFEVHDTFVKDGVKFPDADLWAVWDTETSVDFDKYKSELASLAAVVPDELSIKGQAIFDWFASHGVTDSTTAMLALADHFTGGKLGVLSEDLSKKLVEKFDDTMLHAIGIETATHESTQ